MKRVGYLFESIVEMENLKQAFLKACRGKRLREDCQRFQSNLDKELISRRRRCRTRKCGQLDLSSPRAIIKQIDSLLSVSCSAATNASRPRYVSANAYLPHAIHECGRFDLSRARIEIPNAAKYGYGKRRVSTTNRIGRTLHMPNASADQLIMTDAQMAETASAPELTEDVLRAVDGFGVSRLQKYGKKLLGEKE